MFPKVNCLKCDELVEEDNSFEPNCHKCQIVFLMQENELALSIYSAMSSELVCDANLQSFVFSFYFEELGEMPRHEIEFTFRKLELMHKEIKEFHKSQQPPKPSIPKLPKPRRRR